MEIGPNGPEFTMMLEGFLEHTKQQNSELIEGAVMIFIPDNRDATQAAILSWIPIDRGKEAGAVFSEVFVSLVWTLMSGGLTADDLHGYIDYSAKFHADLDIRQAALGEDDVEN